MHLFSFFSRLNTPLRESRTFATPFGDRERRKICQELFSTIADLNFPAGGEYTDIIDETDCRLLIVYFAVLCDTLAGAWCRQRKS